MTKGKEMTLDRILDTIETASDEDITSIVAAALKRAAEHGQPTMRDCLRAFESLDDTGAFDEWAIAFDDWANES